MAKKDVALSDVTIRLKTPHAEQRKFIESQARRRVVRAGRRGGKTCGVAILAVVKFLAGHRVLYSGPTSDQLQRFWYEVVTAMQPAIDAGIFRKNETDHTIVPAYGTSEARIRAKTAWNADTLRGDYADFLILDEYQLMSPNTFIEVGAPMLLDNNGTAVFIYTGKEGAFHAVKLYKQAKRLQEESLARGEQPRWEVFNFSSADNPYISKEALAEIAEDMTNRAYRMEIMAEDDEDHPGALWNRGLLERTRRLSVGDLERIVVGVDPPGSIDNDCGIVVSGVRHEGMANETGEQLHGFVLEDGSLKGSPATWASQVVALYHKWEADKVVAEQNFGGDMVESALHTVDPHLPVKMVRASRGKAARAEPVVALYEHNKIHHVGEFPDLENEMTRWHPTLAKNVPSPNRLDAMVWSLSELMLDYCATEVGKVEILMM